MQSICYRIFSIVFFSMNLLLKLAIHLYNINEYYYYTNLLILLLNHQDVNMTVLTTYILQNLAKQ